MDRTHTCAVGLLPEVVFNLLTPRTEIVKFTPFSVWNVITARSGLMTQIYHSSSQWTTWKGTNRSSLQPMKGHLHCAGGRQEISSAPPVTTDHVNDTCVTSTVCYREVSPAPRDGWKKLSKHLYHIIYMIRQFRLGCLWCLTACYGHSEVVPGCQDCSRNGGTVADDRWPPDDEC